MSVILEHISNKPYEMAPFFSDLLSCGVMSPCAGHE
ncbi:peptidase, partial [Salmonella enterica subsp. enterica serovar Heidelberg]|nr:peptidase [Salmonella enterica subsp. enterica serovar Heidelberg]